MRTVLFVDDEKDVCDVFSIYLKKKGYDVHVAQNGLEAFRLLKQVKPDIVITDYDMPEINGIELLKEIKKSDPGMPVIMISGRADMRTAVEALKEDAFDFIEKPVDSNVIDSI